MNKVQNVGGTLQTELQIIFTKDSRVSCNGGVGALGHPQIWLTLGCDGQVICPYCSCHFVDELSQSEKI